MDKAKEKSSKYNSNPNLWFHGRKRGVKCSGKFEEEKNRKHNCQSSKSKQKSKENVIFYRCKEKCACVADQNGKSLVWRNVQFTTISYTLSVEKLLVRLMVNAPTDNVAWI